MIDRESLARLVVPALVTAAAAGAASLHGGTPFVHVDSVMNHARTVLQTGGDPSFFRYPGLVIYSQAAGLAVLEALPRGAEPWTSWLASGRLVTALYAVLGALAVFGLGVSLTRRPWLAFAGAVLAVTSPLWNANAHFPTVDLPLTALGAVTVLGLVLALPVRGSDAVAETGQAPRTTHAAIVGFLVGLTAAAKVNGALVAVAVGLAWLVAVRPVSLAIRQMLVAGTLSVATFLACNPFIVRHWSRFTSDLAFELAHARRGHSGFTVEVWHQHVTTSLADGWGPSLLVLSAAGAVWLALDRRHPLAVKIALSTYPLIGLGLLLTTRLSFQRYALPLVPFLAVFIVVLVDGLLRVALDDSKRRDRRRAGVFVAVTLLLAAWGGGSNVRESLRHNELLAGTDTRKFLWQAMRQHASTVGTIDAAFGAHTARWVSVTVGRAERLRQVVRRGEMPALVVVDSFSHDRDLDAGQILPKVDWELYSDRVLVVTPFDRPKRDVPASPQSTYSPSMPDLPYRLAPGPYIELYAVDESLLVDLAASLRDLGAPASWVDSEDAVYRKARSGASAGSSGPDRVER